ncbi:MAG TPA: serine hydrolase [Gemmatimonadaceae bacterium]|jgi:beta-lactamase class A|nr:serine hydrolase [Gemmatimonadaceae bacterium]
MFIGVPKRTLVFGALSVVGCSRRTAPTPGVVPVGGPIDLRTAIAARLDSLPAHATFYARQLSTGREIAIRADEPMNTASVIKIPVMILAFRDAEAGRLDLDARYVIRQEDVRRGTGLLQSFSPGLQPTIRDLITQMIVTSDNTATDIMIAKVGQDRVNRFLDSLGYRDTRLRMSVGETFRVQQNYHPRLADTSAAARNMAFVLDSTQWLGRTTAREISRLLEQIERGQLANATSTAAMRRILRSQFYTSRLPQRVRYRVTLGHKTGDWPPILGNDVGIMYAPSGPIVIAVFTNGNTGSFFQLEATEGRVAEDVLNAWER